MTFEEIFSFLYASVNTASIRRAAAAGEKAAFIAETYRQADLEVCSDDTSVTARIRGTSDRCFLVTGPADVLTESAAVLQKAVSSGKFPVPEYSVCFFHGFENASFQEMDHAAGCFALSSNPCEETDGCVLSRNMTNCPAPQHALAVKLLELISQVNGVKYSVQELPRQSSALPLCRLEIPAKADAPALLKTAAVLTAATAYAASASDGKLKQAIARMSSAEYLELFRARSIEALNLRSSAFESRMIRCIRLGAWRDLMLSAAGSAIKDAGCFKEFASSARQKVNAALQLLCDGDLPPFKSDDNKEIVEVLSASDGTFDCFDGRKTVFETARDLWASKPFGAAESWEGFDNELEQCIALAEQAVQSGLARYKTVETVSIDTLKNTLKALGIVPGDRIMVHSSYKSFGAFEKGPQGIIQALQESVTSSGLLAMPALSDCCDGGTAGVYDRDNTPIEKWVGIIPEIFRRTPEVLRSGHPTHSVCAWGDSAAEFLDQKDKLDCFAPDGPWGKLAQNGKIVFLGEAVGGNTFLHACEAWFVGYLDSIQSEVGGRLVTVTNYPGGCRGNWYGKGRQAPWYVKLRERGIARELKAGPAVITVMDAAETAAAMKEILKEDPALFFHKSGCRDCARIRSLIK